VMVSKDSGAKGGVAEKTIPALERDIHVIMIDRPEDKGYAR
jgi:Precorrin-6x reductase